MLSELINSGETISDKQSYRSSWLSQLVFGPLAFSSDSNKSTIWTIAQNVFALCCKNGTKRISNIQNGLDITVSCSLAEQMCCEAYKITMSLTPSQGPLISPHKMTS